jgi:hypothetical protein
MQRAWVTKYITHSETKAYGWSRSIYLMRASEVGWGQWVAMFVFFYLFLDGNVGTRAEVLLRAAAEGTGAVGAHAPRVASVVVPLQDAPLAHLGGGQLQFQGGGANVRVGQRESCAGGAGQLQRLEALLGLNLVGRVQPARQKNKI